MAVKVSPDLVRRAVLSLAVLPAVAIALLPLVYTVLRATDRGWALVWRYTWSARTGELAQNTLSLLAVVTVSAMVLGTGAAYLLARTDLPCRRMLLPLLVMPLAIPSYVSAFSWLTHFPGLAGFTGSWLVLATSNAPLVLLPVYAALRGADAAPEEVARSLGAGPVRAFFSVTLPQIRLALLAGGLLVALYVLHDYGAVAMMRYETFTKGIHYAYNASFDRTAAGVISLALVVLALLFAVAEAGARGRGATRVGGGVARPAAPLRLGLARPVALLACVILVAASVVMPLGGLLPWLTGRTTGSLDIGELVAALGNTLSFASWGAVLTILLALPVGILAARSGGLFARGVELAAYAGYALPAISVGLALVYFGINAATAWYGRGQMIVLAYIALFLPIAISAVRASVASSPRQFEEVARSLGNSGFVALARVTVPLAAPGILAGAALVFVSCAKELPATLILQPPGRNTLALELWKHAEVINYTQAAWYALALVVVSVVPTVVLQRVAEGRGRAPRPGPPGAGGAVGLGTPGAGGAVGLGTPGTGGVAWLDAPAAGRVDSSSARGLAVSFARGPAGSLARRLPASPAHRLGASFARRLGVGPARLLGSVTRRPGSSGRFLGGSARRPGSSGRFLGGSARHPGMLLAGISPDVVDSGQKCAGMTKGLAKGLTKGIAGSGGGAATEVFP
ncbi:ABC transporter permease [Nocardia sp. NPDC127526]|uniref:ABC transporter permease n=1 Tax=Nocardia sp. NPDC127526 TaxID=3345393 RepID=UPI00362A78BC